MAIDNNVLQWSLGVAAIASPILVIIANSISQGRAEAAKITAIKETWELEQRARVAREAREDELSRIEKEERNEVARKAEEASRRNSALIAEANMAAARRDQVIVGKIDVVHAISNSTLTAAMQLALDGMRRELILMEAVPVKDEQAINQITGKIDELQTVIDERNKQAGAIDLKSQQVDAAAAASTVGNIGSTLNPAQSPTQPQPLPGIEVGPMTKKVLDQISGADQRVADAADATAVAAGATKEAADATVEALKPEGQRPP